MRKLPWLTAVRPTVISFARVSAALCSIAATALALSSSASVVAQQAPSSGRALAVQRIQITAPHGSPLYLSGQERVKVVVVMSAESVAQVRARTVGHAISEQDHAAIHGQLAQQHASVEPSIVARGGRVLGHYYDALNGMKVEIARSEVAGLANIPGVTQVASVGRYTIDNAISVPFIGAPLVWQGTPGFRGEHMKIAMIDTGIDYTHANFGGPGTVAAYKQAEANAAGTPDPSLFGPSAAKVKGGTDLVGDAYNADDPKHNTPMPDPNPLDCNGHGSHTAGTAAGFGVALDGTTYHGPYNQAAYTTGFGIGPGVAPLADLYAVKVFGCTGSTNVVTEAIDWAVHNGMDVISMSLGSPYGSANTADALASDEASKAGVVVVASAGNNGPGLYVVGTPSTGTRVISVAAMDAHQFIVSGVQLSISSGPTVDGVDANFLPLPSGTRPVEILTSGGKLALGCSASDFAGVPSGAIVVISRGTCTFQTKMDNAMAVGASAVGVVNNTTGFINPAISNVTIPFISLLQSDAAKLVAAASPADTGTLAFANLSNPAFRTAATFSSGGPRTGDGDLKPNISAPGVSVFSTLVGSGNGGTYDSGTSMAAPHVSGVAALTLQAHKNWTESAVREAVVETGSPSALLDFAPRIEGMGLVQPVGSTQTQVTVHGENDGQMGPLSFGVAELTRDFHGERDLVLHNHDRTPATFNVSVTKVSGVPHTVTVSNSTVFVRGHDTSEFHVNLQVPAATVGGTHDAQFNVIYEEAAGYITLTPVDAFSNNGVALRLPYYLVPRARSNVDADLRGGDTPFIHIDNRKGVITGNGDFYAWGLKSPKSGAINPAYEPRAVGVQSTLIPGAAQGTQDSVLVFAINTHGRFSNVAAGEFDVLIDVNGDGKPDFDLFSQDEGKILTGTQNGTPATFLLNLATGALFILPIDAPTDGSIVELFALASQLGITSANPRFTYSVNAFDETGAGESVSGTASFNAFTPSVTNGIFLPVPPNTSADIPVVVDPVEFKKTPALGLMVVTEDNVSGDAEAALLPVPKH